MKAQIVRGHGLLNEGVGYPPGIRDLVQRYRYIFHDPRGVGGCSCGAISPPLPSNAARKRWHKAHKAEIVAARE